MRDKTKKKRLTSRYLGETICAHFRHTKNLIYLQGTINKAASLATGRPCTRRIKLVSSNDPLNFAAFFHGRDRASTIIYIIEEHVSFSRNFLCDAQTGTFQLAHSQILPSTLYITLIIITHVPISSSFFFYHGLHGLSSTAGITLFLITSARGFWRGGL